MNDSSANSYDVTPYPAAPYPQSHPDRLSVIGSLFGLRTVPPPQARVLELGCANGSNLLPMAVALPDARFLGVDASAEQIAEARRVASKLGLLNIEFLCSRISQLPAEMPPFDYLIAHGVYSWIPAAEREALMAVAARLLPESGIAYVSYNTYPGWHLRGMLREMMLYHVRKFPEPQTRARQARALVEFLVRFVAGREDPYSLLLRQEVLRMRSWSDAYLLHDALEDVNRPLYFHQFIEQAQRHGLMYLGESELHAMLGRGLPAEARQALEELGGDILETEQYLDFISCRMFRQTLLCRREAPLSRRIPVAALDDLWVATPATCPAGAPDLQSDRSETFRLNQVQWQETSPLNKAALVYLAQRWPAWERFRTVVKEALLQTAGGSVSDYDTAIQALGNAILRWYSHNLVELHAMPPPFTRVPGERPTACPLARSQSLERSVVTNRRHDEVRLDPFHRQLLAVLDGTRTQREAMDEMARRSAGELVQNASQQGPLDEENWRATFARQWEASLARLAQAALLIA